MFTIDGRKYDLEMNTGTILEVISLLGLILVFGSLVWFAKRKQGLSAAAIVLLSLLFVASAGTMLVSRMSFIGVMAYPADDK